MFLCKIYLKKIGNISLLSRLPYALSFSIHFIQSKKMCYLFSRNIKLWHVQLAIVNHSENEDPTYTSPFPLVIEQNHIDRSYIAVSSIKSNATLPLRNLVSYTQVLIYLKIYLNSKSFTLFFCLKTLYVYLHIRVNRILQQD